MNIVIVDVETTGLDPANDCIVEVAAVLFNVQNACVESSFSTLVQGPGNDAEAINRIPAAAVMSAQTAQFAWNRLGEMVEWAECDDSAIYMAHRASFDRAFIKAAAPKLTERLPWVCSKFDVEWPCSKPGASCVEMALAHGVPVVSAHRALTDCMLIANTLSAVARTHDLESLISRAMRPKATFIARVSYDDREKAKAAGFQWDPATRTWKRTMAIEDSANLPFPVDQVA